VEGDDEEKGEQEGFIRWYPSRHRARVRCFLLPQCLMGDRWKVDLSRLLPMSSPGTWVASSKFIGEPEHDQDLVVSDIQISKPFEAWLNIERAKVTKLQERLCRT
jgi:hypothetical protein